MNSVERSTHFPISDRFLLRRALGSGSFGTVYEAYDCQRETVVALKELVHFDAAALLEFKHEFRALAGIEHPSLARLFEMFAVGDRWFITMEYVDGVDFLAYVRAAAPPVDVGRLRRALRQLAEALEGLHTQHRLHRDLKPSNVLVTPSGRVVVVDFGLVLETTRDDAFASRGVGTPAYMAPEQAGSGKLSPACDWYSLGVMLYEALTGRLPFQGTTLQILLSKQQLAAPSPRLFWSDAPSDLVTLCEGLLHSRPEGRPRGRDVVASLSDAVYSPRNTPPSFRSRGMFLGREGHLATLRSALARARQGKAVTAHVRGASGMGKTALIHRFLEEIRGSGEVVVLEGRCYEREAVPYKGLDSLVDALSLYLARLSRQEAAVLLPRDIGTVVRIFPVLARVDAIARAPRGGPEPADAHELRRRGFLALRELFARIADRRALVLHIDDLQWGDADSAALVAEILRPPDAPALLLLGSYRSDDADRSALLRNLPEWLGVSLERAMTEDVFDIEVGPLEPDDAATLSASLLGQQDQELAERIAAESGQSPFFIHVLADVARDRRNDPRAPDPESLELAVVLAQQISRLERHGRVLLEIVAVAGRPISRAMALRAVDLLPGVGHATIEDMCALHMLRTRGAHGDEVETYHDRIREATLARLAGADLHERHLSLAQAIESSGGAEPHLLARHYQLGGRPVEAARYSIIAGDIAASALAFDRAARFYGTALQLRPPTGVELGNLLVKLGDVLRHAGRSAEAARAYLRACEEVPSGEAFELRRRAAENFLASGYLEEGIARLREVLSEVGLVLPSTQLAALGGLLAHRLRLRIRGRRFTERSVDAIDPVALRRLDVCWSAALGLAMIDSLRGAYFTVRSLLAALEAGEPYRIARVLALEITLSAVDGPSTSQKTELLYRDAQNIALRSGRADAIGLVQASRGCALYLQGQWHEALAELDQAAALLRERCTGVPWERGTAIMVATWDLWLLGDIREFARRVPLNILEAEGRGDRYLATNMRSYLANAYWLVKNDPHAALQEVSAVTGHDREVSPMLHLRDLVARIQIDLYDGRWESAHRTLNAAWPALVRTHALRLQLARILLNYLRGATALAFGTAAPGRRDECFRVTHAAMTRLGRENAAWAAPFGSLLRAGLCAGRRDQGSALMSLTQAEQGFRAVGMTSYANAARYLRGVSIAGDEGHVMKSEARAWMQAQGVVDPGRMLRVLAPIPTCE